MCAKTGREVGAEIRKSKSQISKSQIQNPKKQYLD